MAGEELCFEGAAGLLPARCLNSCKGKESRHTGALGKSCAVLGKKLAAECFSKFFKSNCRDLKITKLRAAQALP